MTLTEVYRRLALVANGLFLLGLAALVVKLLGRGGSKVLIGVFGFGMWAAAPTLLLLWYVLRRVNLAGQALAALVGSCLVAAFGASVYFDGFVAHPDPQSGLLLVFVPVYQWVGVVITLICAAWLVRRERVDET